MSDKWPSPSPRDEVLSRVVTRGLRIRLINRVVAVALAVSAVGAGVAVGCSGILPFGTAAPATGGSLPYYLCPATGEAGEFHHGDRVLVTGVDASGNWLQVRDPAALERRVWVQREAVDPDLRARHARGRVLHRRPPSRGARAGGVDHHDPPRRDHDHGP